MPAESGPPVTLLVRREDSMKRWRVVITILGIVLILSILSLFGWLKYPKNLFWGGVKPVSIGFNYSFGQIPGFFKNIFHLGQIIKQNKDLVSENLELQSQITKLSEVKYENEILKKELNFSQSQQVGSELVPSAIIGRTTGFLKAMTIDKGTKDGVAKGQAVVSQGFLVGIISEARPDNADVTLATDFNSLVPVVLQESRGTGLLRGGLQGLSVEDIPLNIQIKQGEVVLTSGLGGEIPAGLSVGKVSATVSLQGEIFQKVTVNSPIDFSKLEVLFVVKK
jgi:rod shape-determining protein MreC